MSPYRLARSPLRTAVLPLLVLALSLAAVVSWKYGYITALRRHATVVLDHVEVPETIRQALQGIGALDGQTAAGSVVVAAVEREAAAATPAAAAAVKPAAATAAAVAAATPDHIEKRCRGTAGTWCRDYFMQTPIPAKPPPSANKTCLWGCNFVGVCDHRAGWCRCPAGWTGDACDTRMKRPCSQHQRRSGFEPYDAPTVVSEGAGTNARCAGLCDKDTGQCFCDQPSRYAHVLAGVEEPPGTPPAKRGRPLSYHCQPNKDAAGNPAPRFGDHDPDDLFGPQGWCNAEQPNGKQSCPCILDGYCGPHCDIPCEAYCPNQCSGHGECNLGFCQCHEGWWGQDCANRTPGTPWTPGMEEKERPWLKDVTFTPVARDPEPGATRLRPLIYVYELPPIFNSIMLQYRVDKGTCVHRLFQNDNSSAFLDAWVYAAEPGIHEALLQSEHRTLDPEEADFFYIPVYAACYIHPIHGFNDAPYFHSGYDIQRVHAATNMMIEAHSWVRSHLPYWDRSGGRDHIITMVHDEGSCWVPAVLRPAIVLSHWGRLDKEHKSLTGYGPDDYSQESSHPVYMPEGHVGKLGNFACYDPEKDLVIPPMCSPQKYAKSPMLGAPALERSILGFFKGRIQPTNPRYSRGIRQFLASHSAEHDWWGKHKIYLGEQSPSGLSLGYSELLASSTFCFALPGDGWSARFEDSVQHGCIPVIINDDVHVHVAFTTLMELDSFSLSIAHADMERIPEILLAVSAERIREMQTNLGAVWRRYAYSGYRPYSAAAKRLMQQYSGAAGAAGEGAGEPKSLPAPEREYDPAEGDAMETIYAWLHSRIPHTRGGGMRRRGRQRRI